MSERTRDRGQGAVWRRGISARRAVLLPAMVAATLGVRLVGGLPLDADTAIRNVTLLHPETGRTEGPSTVLVVGDRIAAIGAEGSVEVPAAAEELDAAGRFLLPGLWDLHTHLTHLDGEHALPLMVTQGVTGVRDLGSIPEKLELLRDRVARGEILSPRIVFAGPTLNGEASGPHHRVIASAEAARQAVADLRAKGVDLLKTHRATGREAYFALLEAAEDAGLTVAGHIPTTVSPLEACRAGQASVEHIVTLFEGTYQSELGSEGAVFGSFAEWLEREAPAIADCFAERGTLFVPTLRTYAFRAHRAAAYDHPDPRRRYLGASSGIWAGYEPSFADRMEGVIAMRQRLVDVGIEFLRMLGARGAAIGAGTDIADAGLLPGFDLHAEIRLLAEGLGPVEALWASCRGPGARAGGDPLEGRLEEGAPANLVLLRENAFESLQALDAIEAVVVRGAVLDRARLDAVLSELATGD